MRTVLMRSFLTSSKATRFGKLALHQSRLHHSGRHIGQTPLFKVRQIDAAIGSPFLGPGLCAPHAIVRETFQ
jgi:hypothetical protein